MFTGIIEATASVLEYTPVDSGVRLVLVSPFDDLQVGESIAVNGVCLTLLPECSGKQLQFDLSPETLQVTNLCELKPGVMVNLERAMSSSSRFGGHYVSGHVDTTATVADIQPVGEYVCLKLAGFSTADRAFLLPKGSICIQGVSLTINAVNADGIELMLIPHTLQQTTLNHLKTGQRVNIEYDYLTRIVAHQVQLLGTQKTEVLCE